MRRGDELRQHILWKAKDVFLEQGFEGASMDAVAARAQTTKRTLYAHFENKQRLFLAVVDLVRDLLCAKLRTPGDYADDPTEAVLRFCGQCRRTFLWKPTIRTCRLGIAEAERFPQGSAGFYEALFGTARERIEHFLRDRFGLPPEQSGSVADELLDRTLQPSFMRALFGVEPIPDEWVDDEAANRAVATSVRDVIARRLPLPLAPEPS